MDHNLWLFLKQGSFTPKLGSTSHQNQVWAPVWIWSIVRRDSMLSAFRVDPAATEVISIFFSCSGFPILTVIILAGHSPAKEVQNWLPGYKTLLDLKNSSKDPPLDLIALLLMICMRTRNKIFLFLWTGSEPEIGNFLHPEILWYKEPFDFKNQIGKMGHFKKLARDHFSNRKSTANKIGLSWTARKNWTKHSFSFLKFVIFGNLERENEFRGNHAITYRL